jgi:acyl carrier protein
MSANFELRPHNPLCEGIEDRDPTCMTNGSALEVSANSLPTEIYSRVTDVLAEALVVDRSRVTPAASLRRELGADSLDLLELRFRLEYEFGIEIPRDELFPVSIFRIDPDWVLDGRLTDIGLTELRSRLPYADPNRNLDDRRMSSVADLITVDLVVSYIKWKLGCRVVPDASCTKALPGTQAQNLGQ